MFFCCKNALSTKTFFTIALQLTDLRHDIPAILSKERTRRLQKSPDPKRTFAIRISLRSRSVKDQLSCLEFRSCGFGPRNEDILLRRLWKSRRKTMRSLNRIRKGICMGQKDRPACDDIKPCFSQVRPCPRTTVRF